MRRELDFLEVLEVLEALEKPEKIEKAKKDAERHPFLAGLGAGLFDDAEATANVDESFDGAVEVGAFVAG